MKKLIFYILFIMPLLSIGCGKQGRYDKAKYWLDATRVVSFANLDSASHIIDSWPKLTKKQAGELRNDFNHYQMICADMAAWELERKIDSVAFNAVYSNWSYDKKVDSLINSYAFCRRYGIVLNIYEGEVMAEIMPEYETTVFKRYLSKCERELQRIFQLEAEKPVVIDEEIVVDYNVIARRLLYCDILMDKFHEDDLYPVIDTERRFYLSMFMYGTDNTPAFLWETGKLRPAIVSTLEKYVSKHPHAHSTEQLKEFLRLVKNNNYERSIETDFFISKTFSLEQ